MIASTLILLGCVAAPRPAPPAGSADGGRRSSLGQAGWSDGWRTVGNLLDPSLGVRLQGAAVLGDGRIVTVGGGKDDYQVFDPVTGTAERVPTPWTADLMLDTAVAPLGDGRLLVVGSAPLGGGRWVHECALLDPLGALAWEELGCPAAWGPGGDPGAIAVSNGVFVYDGTNVPAILERDTLKWSTVGRPPKDSNGYSQLVALDGDRVMSTGFGGDVGFVFDLRDRSFTRTTPIPPPRSGFVLVQRDGKAIAVGGGSATSPDNRVNSYDPESNTWSALPALRQARSNHEALTLPDGTIVVAGGWDESLVRVAAAEVLRPGAAAWTPAGLLNVPRTDPVAVEWNGRVLLLGGSAADGARGDGSFTLSVEPTGVVELATDL